MTAQTPLETVELLDEAFNRSDIEAVLNFYEEDAVMVAEPNRLATGKAEIRATYEWVFANIRGTATQAKTHVIETDDIALFTSQWNFSGTMLNGDSRVERFLFFSHFASANGRQLANCCG